MEDIEWKASCELGDGPRAVLLIKAYRNGEFVGKVPMFSEPVDSFDMGSGELGNEAAHQLYSAAMIWLQNRLNGPR